MSELSKVSSVFGLDLGLTPFTRGFCVAGLPVDARGTIPDAFATSGDVSFSEDTVGSSGDGVGSSGRDDDTSCCCRLPALSYSVLLIFTRRFSSSFSG